MKQIIALFAVFAAISAGAQEFQVITPGSDLAGWKVISGEWSVKDGVLTGRAKPYEEAILIDDREYADAELELDLQTSGVAKVYIRGHALPKLPFADGVDPAAAPREIRGDGAGRQSDAWGTLAISAKGDALAASFNQESIGNPTASYLKGHIAFFVRGDKNQAFHGKPSEAKFRNIKVKDLGRLGKWRPLFDGKSLDGWIEWGQEKWSVEDGVIWGRSGEKKSEGYLATKETWKDFHVRGTFKMAGEGNFGLFYHSTIKYDDKQYPVISGVQGEVAPADPSQGNASPSGWVYESYKRGWLVEPDMKSPAAFALKPADWNEIEIKSEGRHIQTWINGIPVVDWTDPAPNLTEGSFALQLHTGGVDGIAWKDLFVKE